MTYNIGDIVTDSHSGGTWNYRISSFRDGGVDCPVIRRYTAQMINKDGSLSAEHYLMPELSHFVE